MTWAFDEQLHITVEASITNLNVYLFANITRYQKPTCNITVFLMCKDTHSVGFIHNTWYRQKISPHLREVKRSIMSICPGIIKWYHYCFLTRRSVLHEYRFREDYMANEHRWWAFLQGCRWRQKSWVCPQLLLQDCTDFCHWETGLGCGSEDCYWSPLCWNHHQSFLPFVKLSIVNKWLWNILCCKKKEHRYKIFHWRC